MSEPSLESAAQSDATDMTAQLAALEEVFARAAVGDFSQDLHLPVVGGELAPIFRSVQQVLQAVREKMAEAELLQDQLAELVENRTRALERTQSYFSSVMEHAPNYIQIIDPDLRVTYINRTEGMKREEIVGKKMGWLMPPAQRRRVRRTMREILRTGKPADCEYSATVGEDGAELWYRASAGPIWENGVIAGVVMIIFDVTEDRLRTRALREGKRQAEAARARDRTLLDSIGEGLIVVDQHGAIATVNPSAARMLGFTPEEMVGRWFPGTVRAFRDDGEEVAGMDRPAIRALSTGRIITEVVYYQRKDGSRFPAALTISPVVMNGRPQGSIEVFRDLTSERELDRAKEEFVSLASHQLRTPATGVKAYISMLLDGYAGSISRSQREFLQKVYESNERQLQIVNDMLNVARVDAGRIIPEPVSTDLVALIRDIIDEQRPIIAGREQRLDVRLPNGHLELTLDPRLIRMVIENLLSNASKYTPEGGQIQLRLERAAAQVRLSVHDSGVGIAEADLPRLFKRFSRIDNPLSTERGGSGLGLYLAQTIVLLHKGRLSVQSQVGAGTTFTVELPIEQAMKSRRTTKQPVGKARTA